MGVVSPPPHLLLLESRWPGSGGRSGNLLLVATRELGLAEVEVLRLTWAMGAGGDRHVAADFLEGQRRH